MTEKTTGNDHPYLRALGLALLLVTLYLAKDSLLVLFAAVLGAVLLTQSAKFITDRLPLSYRAALSGVLLTATGALVLFGFLAGPELVEQSTQLTEELPKAAESLQERLSDYPLIEEAWLSVREELSASALKKPLTQAKVIFSGVMGVLSGLLLFLASTVYLAFQPQPYTAGFKGFLKKMFGPEKGESIKRDLHQHLWGFLVAQMQTMIILGTLTTIGLWLIGMPNFIALGAIAGLLAFVPVIGPLFSLAPALLIALSESPQMMLTVTFLYLGIQLLESNLITPVLQQRNSELPPVLTLAFQAILGSLCGTLGVLVAAPLAVVAMVFGDHWLKPFSTSQDDD